MDKRTLRWVYRELPELVSQGVVPPEVAERVRLHYGEPDAPGATAKRWAIILFSILGAGLIAGGVILLLAHNWDELSRPVRAVISVAPLVIAASLGGWLLWTERTSTAWREGVGTAHALAIGASIALVSQTYNLGGLFSEYMLTWSLLALPISYLLRATVPALLYLVGIAVWSGSTAFMSENGLAYFPLLALALPFLWWTSRENLFHPRSVLLTWVLAVTVCVGTGFAEARLCGRLDAWPVLFSGLFGLLFLIGARWWGDAGAVWQRPFQNIGALGAVGLSLVLSFADSWEHGGWNRFWQGASAWRAGLQLAVAAVFQIAAIALWVRSWTRRAWSEVMVGAVPALAVIGWAVAMKDASAISAVLFNLYLLALGIGTLAVGLRERRLAKVNAGMLVLAAVILCRFFDSDLGFVVRGVAFIAIGIGFLMTNMVLLRWKGTVRR